MYLRNEKYKHIDIIYELIAYIEFINVLCKTSCPKQKRQLSNLLNSIILVCGVLSICSSSNIIHFLGFSYRLEHSKYVSDYTSFYEKYQIII